LSIFLCSFGFGALDSITEVVLEGGQDLIVTFYILAMLLIIVQSKSGVNANEYESHLGQPSPEAWPYLTLFGCLVHF
jgi:hypothetical protein